MKLVKRLPSRRDKNGKMRQYGIFFCSYCNQEVEKQIRHKCKFKSCGCSERKLAAISLTKHGSIGTKLYQIWERMRSRCFCKGNGKYHCYGGRGITICNEWLEFIPFKKWALKNEYQEGLTIDRVDNDGNYEPDNCQFITHYKNSQKTRRTKLNQHKARIIRAKYSTGKRSLASLGREYNVTSENIGRIIKNETWIEGRK